jgi:hypothetical protein
VDVATLKNCVAGSGTPFGLGPTDCQVILNQDPFAAGSTTVDPQRFTLTAFYSYLPATSCSNVTYELDSEDDTSDSHEVEKDTAVGYSLSADSGEWKPAFNAVAKIGQTFTWTNSSTTENTTDSTQKASFKLACPAYNQAHDWIGIYWDYAYSTFMFMPMDLSQLGMPIYEGHLTNPSGAAMPRTPVQLVVNGKSLRTATDKNGDYKFVLPRTTSPARIPPSAQFIAAGVRKTVPLNAAAKEPQKNTVAPIRR